MRLAPLLSGLCFSTRSSAGELPQAWHLLTRLLEQPLKSQPAPEPEAVKQAYEACLDGYPVAIVTPSWQSLRQATQALESRLGYLGPWADKPDSPYIRMAGASGSTIVLCTRKHSAEELLSQITVEPVNYKKMLLTGAQHLEEDQTFAVNFASSTESRRFRQWAEREEWPHPEAAEDERRLVYGNGEPIVEIDSSDFSLDGKVRVLDWSMPSPTDTAPWDGNLFEIMNLLKQA